MIRVIDPNTKIEFTSKHDTQEPKTVFVLKPLNGIEMMEFSEGKKDDILEMVVRSIIEVKNFPLENQTNRQIVNLLSINVLGELIQKINSINTVTGEDQKN